MPLSKLPFKSGGGDTMSFYEKIPASIAAVTNLAGQFHSGSDNVASEGSYLLQKGERVVQSKANKKLTQFLDKDSDATSGNIDIEVPMNVAGNVTDKAWFQSELYKHRQ